MKRSSGPRATAELSKSLNHQLNTYALAAGAAGVGLLALAQPAEAKVVYTKAHHVIYGQQVIFNLDLNHDGIVDFVFFLNSGTERSWQMLYVLPRNVSNRVWEMRNFWADAFPPGVRIGPSGVLAKPPKDGPGGALRGSSLRYPQMEGWGWFCKTNPSSSCGPWVDVKNRYLGLSFLVKGKTHYGWARLSASIADHHVRATLTGYAYETIPNKPIITGKTKGPDVTTVFPASLGHLAAGASAIPAWRSGK